MPAQHRAARPRGRRLAIWAGIVAPVLVLAGIVLIQLTGGTKPAASDAAAAAQTARTCSAAAASAACASPSADGTTATTPGDHQPAVRHHKRPAPRHTHPAPPHPAPSSPARSHPASPPPAPRPSPTSPGSQQSSAVQQVLALINQARAQAGLPAYTVISGLDRSSAGHNQKMASGCGLSHQCPGEASLGARETAAGVDWTSAGENIGEGGPEPGTAAAIAKMAVTLTQDMLNEKPPDDGHRLNILSSSFHHIGVTVQRDSSGTVWMTQDFSN
jgi:uncharacterized protein YkwD